MIIQNEISDILKTILEAIDYLKENNEKQECQYLYKDIKDALKVISLNEMVCQDINLINLIDDIDEIVNKLIDKYKILSNLYLLESKVKKLIKIFTREDIRINIGGSKKIDKWINYGMYKYSENDIIGNYDKLSIFENNSLSSIYSSYILQHFDFIQIEEVLREWFRALKVSSRIYISVPNIDIISSLIIKKDFSDISDRVKLINILFDSHVTGKGYSKMGLNYELITYYLNKVGFEEITTVEGFNFLDDESTWKYKEIPLSLNVTALKNYEHCSDESPLNKVLSFKTKGTPDIVLFGDSVMNAISYKDLDIRSLKEMILKDKNIVNYDIDYFCHYGYHFGVYYMLIQALKYLDLLPKIIILPINMRSFSPQWDLKPAYQFDDTINEIKDFFIMKKEINLNCPYDIDKQIDYNMAVNLEAEFWIDKFKIIKSYEDIVNLKYDTDAENKIKYQTFFIYHYLYKLNENNRKLRLLEQILKCLENEKVKIVMYFTPININAGQKFVGKDFITYFRENVNMVLDMLKTYEKDNLVFENFSELCDCSCFTYDDDPTEHLNEKGRKLLSDRIMKTINHCLR